MNTEQKNTIDYELFKSHPVVTTDSRHCPEGSIFFALKGDKFDGNKFAAKALESGCAYAVVDNKDYAVDERYIVVDDTLKALQLLANEHRRRMRVTVIGITGTNGKTTTKELVSAVLKKNYNVVNTEGNLNNHIGVPLTLLRITPEHRIAVVEMGANHPGEIAQLTKIAEPDYALITNVGRAHLEGFGSFETLVNTKCALYDSVSAKGNYRIYVNKDDSILMEQAQQRDSNPYTYSIVKGEAKATGRVMECNPFLKFSLDIGDCGEWRIKTHLVGAYNVYNILAAVAIGRDFNVPDHNILRAIEDYVPTNNRSQFVQTESNGIIVDAYNANPTSMMAALENFVQIDAADKMAILGDMRELGQVSHEEHQKVVDYLKEHNIDNVWLIGDEFAKTECDYRKFHDVEQVKEEITSHPVKGKTLLIKGSNSMHLYELPALL